MTQVEICNRALAVLGHDRTIASMTDGSTEAVRCSMFWPVARDSVLSAFVWEFATASVELDEETETDLPADCLRIVDLRDEDGKPVVPVRAPGKITSPVDATLRYVSNTVDVGTYPNGVAEAVVYELAFRLYAPMLGNPNTQDSVAAQQSFSSLAKAKLDAAKELELEEHAYLGAMQDPDSVAKTDVANRALAIVGCPRSVRSFDDDPSAEAVRCRQLLPMALRRVLSMHPWESAIRSASVTGASTYAVTANFVQLVSAADSTGRNVLARLVDGTVAFPESGDYTIRYVSADLDYSKMPTAFLNAVTMALATALAPIFSGESEGGAQRVQFIGEQFAASVKEAVEAEGREATWRGSPADENAIARTDVANRALAICGVSANVRDFDTDTGAVAVRCRQLLPMAMKRVLSAHDWEFARKSVTVTAAEWTRASDYVRLVSVRDSDGRVANATLSGAKIVFDASGTYTVRYVSSDVSTASLPPCVVDAVVYQLAAALMPSFLDREADAQKAQIVMKQAESTLATAIESELQESAWRGEPADDELGKLDVVNRALAAIGSAMTVKDFYGDATPVAVRARQLFGACLRKTLRHRDWDFAAVEIPVTLAPTDADGYARMFPPEDCVRLSTCTDERGNPLECRRARDAWYVRTDGRRAVIRYVSNDFSIDEAPEEFAELVVAELAARLAPTVLAGVRNAAASVAALEEKARRAFAAESFTEANETAKPGEWENPLVSCRR